LTINCLRTRYTQDFLHYCKVFFYTTALPQCRKP